ncbi:hypothetical protein XFEB_02185 [Xylella fastidiosa EB92.1]|jgi:hypothetical protein|nr:hypothetical protein XFEB_02185 [Xylella fastidiosa EB92.1]
MAILPTHPVSRECSLQHRTKSPPPSYKSGWHQHHRIPPSGSTAQIQIALSGEDREQQADLRNGLKTISPRFDNLLQCVIQESNRQLYGIPMQTEATERFQ